VPETYLNQLQNINPKGKCNFNKVITNSKNNKFEKKCNFCKVTACSKNEKIKFLRFPFPFSKRKKTGNTEKKEKKMFLGCKTMF